MSEERDGVMSEEDDGVIPEEGDIWGGGYNFANGDNVQNKRGCYSVHICTQCPTGYCL